MARSIPYCHAAVTLGRELEDSRNSCANRAHGHSELATSDRRQQQNLEMHSHRQQHGVADEIIFAVGGLPRELGGL